MFGLYLGLCRGVLVVGIPEAHVLSLHVHAYKGRGRFAHVRTLLLPLDKYAADGGTWALNSIGDIVWVSKSRSRLFVISVKGKIKVQRFISPSVLGGVDHVSWCTGSLAILCQSHIHTRCELAATVYVFSDAGFPLFVAVLNGFIFWQTVLYPGWLQMKRLDMTAFAIEWLRDDGGKLTIRTVRGCADSYRQRNSLIHMDASFYGVHSIVHPDTCACVVFGRFVSISAAMHQVTGLGLWASHEGDKRMLCMSAMRTCWLSSCA
jgi:hypothetical protein